MLEPTILYHSGSSMLTITLPRLPDAITPSHLSEACNNMIPFKIKHMSKLNSVQNWAQLYIWRLLGFHEYHFKWHWSCYLTLGGSCQSTKWTIPVWILASFCPIHKESMRTLTWTWEWLWQKFEALTTTAVVAVICVNTQLVTSGIVWETLVGCCK